MLTTTDDRLPREVAIATKAWTIQSSGKFIEDRVNELKDELDRRLNEVLQVLARAG
ncbi:MAG TPA: hypothetical protein VF306_05595 [Pirellulales bacterium]